MKEMYNTTRFREHVRNAACDKLVPGASKAGQKRKLSQTFGGGMKTLFMFKGFHQSSVTALEPVVSASDSDSVQSHAATDPKGTTLDTNRACPGLSETNTPRVKAYMERSNYSGGGGKSYKYWVETLFSKMYHDLPSDQKEVVQDEARAKLAWQFDGAREVIHSKSCLGTARISLRTGEPLPCVECYSVSCLESFKDAMRYKARPNQQFTNKRWMSKLSGSRFAKIQGVGDLLQDVSHESAPVRYAKRVLSGKVKVWDVFLGMLEAIGLLEERERRQRARDLRFPSGICDTVFDLARSYLDKVGYNGLVCLACDDTKLSPALRTYYDSTTEEWKLIGGVGEPIVIANNEELLKILRSGNIQKASKIRLWVLQIPLPNIPPLAIAALAIPSTVAADRLVEHLQAILDGLISKDIQVISYALDGSAIERRVQAMIFRLMKPHECTIPFRGALVNGSINFTLGFYKGHPLVLIQDLKHALKTCRNNLLSGARLLVLGNSCAMYSQVHDMAMDPGSTLHRRDVEKLDRQDDNSAECLFNAPTLLYISKVKPHNKALAVYLYVFGELCDAYQSRHITHSERFKMVMHARFFMENWRKYLLSTGYSHARYFISDVAYKILNELIDGLVLLIFVHRDHMPVKTPLLPWLHLTEACEHLFGKMRKLVADFTHLDFIFAAPKLRVLLRASYQNHSSGLLSMQPKPQKATGYSHTYMDSSGLKLKTLTIYPSDAELSQLTLLAHTEALELSSFLKCNVEVSQDFRVFSNLEPSEPEIIILPGIDSFNNPEEEGVVSVMHAFHEIVEFAEKEAMPLEEISVPRDNLVYAAAALQVESGLMIDNLPPETSNDIEAERDLIRTYEHNFVREIQIPEIQNPPLKKENHPINLLTLVQVRKAHQNPRAWKSSKKASKWIAELLNESPESEAVETSPEPKAIIVTSKTPTHSELAQAFSQTLRDEEKAKLPDRLKWWTAREDNSQLKGNTANAKEASDR
ncbi:hypothetical protein FRC11_010105 [Ceratobasidium sp. 423]|nr:hypothetical protein FRC11_010105 [Ceratobasidium sp. 423]